MINQCMWFNILCTNYLLGMHCCSFKAHMMCVCLSAQKKKAERNIWFNVEVMSRPPESRSLRDPETESGILLAMQCTIKVYRAENVSQIWCSCDFCVCVSHWHLRLPRTVHPVQRGKVKLNTSWDVSSSVLYDGARAFIGACPTSLGFIRLKHILHSSSSRSINESLNGREMKWNASQACVANLRAACFMVFERKKVLVINQSKRHGQRLLADFTDCNALISQCPVLIYSSI